MSDGCTQTHNKKGFAMNTDPKKQITDLTKEVAALKGEIATLYVLLAAQSTRHKDAYPALTLEKIKKLAIANDTNSVRNITRLANLVTELSK